MQAVLGLILNPVSVGEEAQGSQDVVDCSNRRATRRCIVIFIFIFSLLSGVSEIVLFSWRNNKCGQSRKRK